MVRLQWGQMSEQLFKTMGFKNYNFKVYKGMVHSSSDQVRHSSLDAPEKRLLY